MGHKILGGYLMSVQLLDKTRKIYKLLQASQTNQLIFNDICKVLSDIIMSNVIVISKKGKVLGIKNTENIPIINHLITNEIGNKIDSLLNERFQNILSTTENISLLTLGFKSEEIENYNAIVSPITIAGERLGTLFAYKTDNEYGIDDIILSEYSVTVIALEMMRSITEEQEGIKRKKQIVKSAINTLSFSELEAILHIFDELDGVEGILVASKIADRVGITRSVIVNALRKFESAGVIETRSSGMKGTYIKVINDVVFHELEEKKLKKLEENSTKQINKKR